jgi:DNA-binding transcriptional MocR family regulator
MVKALPTIEEDHLYEQMAGKIHQLIELGTLRPGDRVPSVRKLSEQHDVSIATVLQAYMLLEDKGLIEAKPQSGYYVRTRFRELLVEPAKTAPSQTACCVSVGELAMRILRTVIDPGMVPLGAGVTSPELFPSEKLHRVLAAVARRHGAATNRYEGPAGNAEFRRQIARRSLDWGCAVTADDVISTIGCMEAINLSLRAVAKPGDSIAVESPTFFGVLQIIETLGMKAVEVGTYPRHGMCLDELSAAVRRHKIAAVIVTPNFQNPLGALMPDEKKKALVEMLAKKEVPIVEDDIYGDIPHEGPRPKALKSFDKQGLVLLCSSVSKTLAPGFRVGWCVPGRFKEKVERLKFSNTCSSPVLTQLAVAEFLQNGGYDYHLRGLRKRYAQQVHLMLEAIAKYFPEGTKVTQPKGGFLLWVELPKAVNALDLHERAAEQRVSVAPGPLFSPKPNYKNFLRINCGYPFTPQIEHAVMTVGRLAGKN